MANQDYLNRTKRGETIRAAIYSRVSTTGQEYERQTAELKEYAAKEGYTVVHCYEEKITGRKNSRPQFNKLRACTREDIDIILVWELSRLSRDAITLQIVVKEFVEKGIQIYCLKDQRYTLDSEGRYEVSTKLLIAFAATMAEEELNSIKERMQSGRLYRLENGGSYVNKPPYGYYLDENKYLTINEEERKVVERIYQMALDGYSQVRIAQQLNAEQITRPRGDKTNRWIASSIASILKNTIYCGFAYYAKGKPNEKKVQTPAIISEETYKAAQAAKDSRKKTSNSAAKPFDALLRGLIVCSKCGHIYTPGHRQYSCWTKLDKRAFAIFDCDAPCINRANLDYIIWELVKKTCSERISSEKLQAMLNPILEEMAEIDNTIVQYQEQITVITKQIQKYAIKMLDMDGIAYETVRNKIKELEGYNKQSQNEIDRLEARYTQLKKQEDAINNNTSEISITEFSDKREIVVSMIKQIIVFLETKDLRRVEVTYNDGRKFEVLYKFDHHIHHTVYCTYEAGNRPEDPEYIALPTFESNIDRRPRRNRKKK